MCVASKFHKFVPSCYSCSLALTPYDLNVFNEFLKKVQWKEEKKAWLDNKKNLTITLKWKFWNSSHAKGTMHSLEKIHELILNYMI